VIVVVVGVPRGSGGVVGVWVFFSHVVGRGSQGFVGGMVVVFWGGGVSSLVLPKGGVAVEGLVVDGVVGSDEGELGGSCGVRVE